MLVYYWLSVSYYLSIKGISVSNLTLYKCTVKWIYWSYYIIFDNFYLIPLMIFMNIYFFEDPK
jgi:hypothetical protein